MNDINVDDLLEIEKLFMEFYITYRILIMFVELCRSNLFLKGENDV